MFKLEPPTRDPRWIDLLPGVRIEVRPPTVADILLARAEAADALTSGDGTERSRTIAAGAAFSRALARSAIVGWDGVGDTDGEPVAPNPERIDQLMDHWPAFDAFDRAYVTPALARIEEKNG